MKKAAPYILIAILALAVFAVRTCRGTLHGPNRGKETTDVIDRDHGFDRRVSYLEYTQHAKCRMDCRHITQEEVKYIMEKGTINYRKSEASARPCPVYAVEGYSQDNQHLRIVFAQCDYKTKVVTCIDLEHEFECHCPGDGNKHEQ